MNSTKSPNKKLTIGLTTVNLFMWVWAVERISGKEATAPSTPMVAGIGLMLAAWIQYRAVLASRSQQGHSADLPQN
ncbi:MAG: hypothetical protein RLZZ15_4474 [Verrucomicrobiota bacterium]|jgi:hypothetical protein